MADVLHASSKNLIPRLSRHSSLNSSTPPKLRKAADRTSDLKNEVRNRRLDSLRYMRATIFVVSGHCFSRHVRLMWIRQR
jgi:hypothetical protein